MSGEPKRDANTRQEVKKKQNAENTTFKKDMTKMRNTKEHAHENNEWQ